MMIADSDFMQFQDVRYGQLIRLSFDLLLMCCCRYSRVNVRERIDGMDEMKGWIDVSFVFIFNKYYNPLMSVHRKESRSVV